MDEIKEPKPMTPEEVRATMTVAERKARRAFAIREHAKVSKKLREQYFDYMRDLIGRSHWIFAKTRPNNPHYYMLRKESDDQEFIKFVKLIRRFGEKTLYRGEPYILLDIDDWSYWTMGAPIEDTILINRKKRLEPTEVKTDQVTQPVVKEKENQL